MKINRTTLRDRCRKAMAGIDKYLASEATIPIDGSAMPPADIKKDLQNAIDAADATQAARAAWIKSSATEVAARGGTVSTLANLQSFVTLKFGSSAIATLADFGFDPPRRKVPAVETRAAAVDKALATRAARHTMGPKQKAKIKGTVAVTEPATAPAASTPPTAPVVVAPAAPVTQPKP